MNSMNMDNLDINSILSDASNLKHGLVLFASNIDKYAFQASFLASTRPDEKVIYITNDDPDIAIKKFSGVSGKICVLKPEKLGEIKLNKKAKIIFDAASIDKEDHIKCEKYLKQFQKKSSILCGYDVAKISPAIIRDLVATHDKLILMAGDVSILSGEALEKFIADESLERYVKNDLKMIIFALLMNNPMCGTDIIKEIHKNFNILLSPGTIYPLLHSLEKRGFVQYDYVVKKKIYKLSEISLDQVKGTIDEHVKASGTMNKFLLSAIWENKKSK